MTTTPDPKTVREIAQEATQRAARRRDYIDSVLHGHAVMETLARGDRSAYGRWRDAISAEMETATVTVSWPDEQPQDMCSCNEPRVVCELRTELDKREIRIAELEAENARMREGRDWKPGRWCQVRQPDGSLWMETSDHEEAEAEAREQGWPLYRLWECRETEWRIVADAAPQQRDTADGGAE